MKSEFGDGAISYDGEIDFFPGAQVNVAPVEETINGVIVVDASDTTTGWSTRPIPCSWEDGIIQRVEGGPEADLIRNWLETIGARDEKVYRLCHASIGMNPAARISGNLMEDERKLAALDFGFGFQYPEPWRHGWGTALPLGRDAVDAYDLFRWKGDERRGPVESRDGV